MYLGYEITHPGWGRKRGACPALPCARPRPSPRSVVVFRSLARRVLRGRLASLASAIPRAARLPALALSASLSCPAPPIHACASRPSCPAPLGFGGRSRCARGGVGRLSPPTPRPHCASLLALRNLALSSQRACPALPCARALPPLRPPGVSAACRRGDPVRPPPLAPPLFRWCPLAWLKACTVQSSCHRCSRASRACFPRALNYVKYYRSPLRPFRGSARGILCQNISSACFRKIRGSAAYLRPLHGLSYPSPIHRR